MSLGDLSRLVNRLTGGKEGESLCARWVRTSGSDCWQCRFVGFFLGREHCWEEFIDFQKKERRK